MSLPMTRLRSDVVARIGSMLGYGALTSLLQVAPSTAIGKRDSHRMLMQLPC